VTYITTSSNDSPHFPISVEVPVAEPERQPDFSPPGIPLLPADPPSLTPEDQFGCANGFSPKVAQRIMTYAHFI
jgi:hypothetical protein